VLLASSRVLNRDPWIGPLAFLTALAVGAQGVDAIRTGRLEGWFPNKFPITADRLEQPISFWNLTVTYVLMGLLFITIGIIGIFELVRRVT